MEKIENRFTIEAILFSSGEPVNIGKIAKFLKLSAGDCRKEIEALATDYERNKRGITLVTKGDEVQMVSSKEHSDRLATFFNREFNEELSPAAAEVLAVIAYKGPIARAQIEQIRGVNCSFTLRNLAIRGLIERKDNPTDSRAFLYEVSMDFLKSLGLTKVGDLPDYEDFHKVFPSNQTSAGKSPVSEEENNQI